MISSLSVRFTKVFISEDSMESEVAERCRLLFDPSQIQIVKGHPYPEVRGELSPRSFNQSKRELFITTFKGAFFKRCPGAKPGLSCCNYFVLNLGVQCDMNCSYCYLQSFINSPVLTIYSNIDRALAELRDMATLYPDRQYRVGTGETTDSLSMDDLTLYSKKLVGFFRDLPGWKLEFKTKSALVDHFLEEPHAKNVIVSWSINPQEVVSREEHGTASLKERLFAARRCRDKGFTVAFHMDPMIWHPNWQKNYLELVDEIARQFTPSEVAWITVGALRFQPEQRHMMRSRFGANSLVTQAEVFPSSDGKLRYDRGLRNEMFQHVVDRFKQLDPAWRISLCMETKESWALTMASTPLQVPELHELFDKPGQNRAGQPIVSSPIIGA